MQIDLAPAMLVLAPLMLAAITAAVPYGLVLARRAIGLKLTSQQQKSVTAAVDAGAQAAYGFLATNGASFLDVPMRNKAIANGVNHVVAAVAPALKALSITPERVHAMVDARLGGLLAADPTVSLVAQPAKAVQTTSAAESAAPDQMHAMADKP